MKPEAETGISLLESGRRREEEGRRKKRKLVLSQSPLVGGCFQRRSAARRTLQECRALHLKRFQIRSQSLLVPTHHGANPRCGLATAGFSPASAQRHRDP